ncbi:MAG: hypothetical protein J2P20_12690 [Pseudonocardia sp.]|nr:hypothetical protein [Pseudonocardia sp.]MBO0874060.1 hypothetical protein [Pseudonocardia sp.]
MSERSEGGTRPPTAVRVAGLLVAVQGAVGVAFAVFLAVEAGAARLGRGAALGEALMFLLIGAALLGVARGLWRGRFWARAPAVVTQLLLLAFVYSLFRSGQLLPGAVAGVVVVGTLVLMLSAPARAWAMDLDEARRKRQ